jgi:hypothetical protein
MFPFVGESITKLNLEKGCSLRKMHQHKKPLETMRLKGQKKWFYFFIMHVPLRFCTITLEMHQSSELCVLWYKTPQLLLHKGIWFLLVKDYYPSSAQNDYASGAFFAHTLR